MASPHPVSVASAGGVFLNCFCDPAELEIPPEPNLSNIGKTGSVLMAKFKSSC